jgi:hypothetical protein
MYVTECHQMAYLIQQLRKLPKLSQKQKEVVKIIYDNELLNRKIYRDHKASFFLRKNSRQFDYRSDRRV